MVAALSRPAAKSEGFPMFAVHKRLSSMTGHSIALALIPVSALVSAGALHVHGSVFGSDAPGDSMFTADVAWGF